MSEDNPKFEAFIGEVDDVIIDINRQLLASSDPVERLRLKNQLKMTVEHREQFTGLITSLLQQNSENLASYIAEETAKREENNEGYTASLVDNEKFQIALGLGAKTSLFQNHDEKLKILRNAILNSAEPTAPEIEQLYIIFQLIDELSPLHIKVLDFLDDPDGNVERTGLILPTNPDGKYYLAELVDVAFPNLKPGQVDYIIRDLSNRALITIGAIIMIRREEKVTGEPGYRQKDGSFATDMGKLLLGAIKLKDEDKDVPKPE